LEMSIGIRQESVAILVLYELYFAMHHLVEISRSGLVSLFAAVRLYYEDLRVNDDTYVYVYFTIRLRLPSMLYLIMIKQNSRTVLYCIIRHG